MGWKIEHTYDPEFDVVNGRFNDVRLNTPADVERWRQESEAQYKAIGKRVDLLVDLDGLEVSASVRHEWTVARRYLADNYIGRIYRYNGKAWIRTHIYTGAVLEKAGGEIYATRDAALAALLRDRARKQ
jgi:hypothetical protein